MQELYSVAKMQSVIDINNLLTRKESWLYGKLFAHLNREETPFKFKICPSPHTLVPKSTSLANPNL